MHRVLSRRVVALAAAVAVVAFAARGAAEDAPASAPRAIDEKEVEAVLREAGFPPVGEKTPFGYRVEQKRPEGVYFAHVATSPDGAYLWLTAPLEALPAGETSPRRALVELLAFNAGDGGAAFSLAKDRIHLMRAVDNRALTPALVALEIEAYFDLVRRTVSLWDPARWGPRPDTGEGGMR